MKVLTIDPGNRRLRLTVVNKNIQKGDFFIHLFFHAETYVGMSVVDEVKKTVASSGHVQCQIDKKYRQHSVDKILDAL